MLNVFSKFCSGLGDSRPIWTLQCWSSFDFPHVIMEQKVMIITRTISFKAIISSKIKHNWILEWINALGALSLLLYLINALWLSAFEPHLPENREEVCWKDKIFLNVATCTPLSLRAASTVWRSSRSAPTFAQSNCLLVYIIAPPPPPPFFCLFQPVWHACTLARSNAVYWSLLANCGAA